MNHATEFVPVECLCIPKALFFDKRYEDLSVDAKILYSLLLDRKEMAVRNGWIDRYGAVYVLYSRGDGSPDGTINLIFHFCFPASTGFICQIFFIGSSRFRSRHRRGKIIVFANSITYPADFVVGAFIGNVFMVICKTMIVKFMERLEIILMRKTRYILLININMLVQGKEFYH